MAATLNDPHVVKLVEWLQDRFREVSSRGIRHVLINIKEPGIQQLLSLKERDEAVGLLYSLDLLVPRVKAAPGTFEVSPLILMDAKPRRHSTGDRPKKKTWSPEIISKLTLHHQYDQDSCLNLEPLGVRELSGELNCSASVVSEFFKREFDGHKVYVGMCSDAGRLATAIRMLRGEIRPSILNQGLPGNDGRDVPDR